MGIHRQEGDRRRYKFVHFRGKTTESILSERELDILKELATRKSYKSIGEK